MIYKFTSVLSDEQLSKLQNKICNHINLTIRDNNSYVGNCIEGYIHEADSVLNIIHNLVREVYPHPLKYSNSFCRTYQNGAWMGVHVDRPGLDVTVSFCLKKESIGPWPLCVSKKHYDPMQRWDESLDVKQFKSEYEAVNLETNEMCCILGTTSAHWRDTLHCEKNQENTYIFYHWSFENAVDNTEV